MGFVEPLPAFAVSFLFLGLMVYKRVGLGIALALTALFLSMLSLDIGSIPSVFEKTVTDSVTVSLVLATFGIMLLSQLYKETGFVTILSRSLSEIVKNSKFVISVLPAIIGLLPVPGGALMSAPMVEVEAKKLKLEKARQTYVNIWFRHTIFPIYPMSQVLILTGALTGLSVLSLIMRQVPVVVAMVAVGYLIGFWKVSATKHDASKMNLASNLTSLLKVFAPILAMIFVIVSFSIDVSIAAFLGVIVLLLIARPSLSAVSRPLRSSPIYMVTLAAFGAMLLRNVTIASGVSEVFAMWIAGRNVYEVVLLSTLPAALAFLLGSPSGGIAISVSMLAGIISFAPKAGGLLYMATYLGYLGAPTHLCLVLTADYFKCSLSGVYKYLVPSLAISFLTAILVYFLL